MLFVIWFYSNYCDREYLYVQNLCGDSNHTVNTTFVCAYRAVPGARHLWYRRRVK